MTKLKLILTLLLSVHVNAEEFDVPMYGSINQALTLGGKELAVDGVLLIGEHGDYPWNEKEHHQQRVFF